MKWLPVALMLLIILLMTSCRAVSGDVNGDGIITPADAAIVRLSVLGLRTLTPAERRAADMNGDGAVSVSDYTLIRLKYRKWWPLPPVYR